MGAVKMFTPYDLRPTIEITAFTLTGVSTLVVGVRFFCRIWIVGRLKIYDYIMFAALLCTWALCVCNHYQLMFGSGAPDFSKLPPPPNVPKLSLKEFQALMAYLYFGSAVTWYSYHLGYVAALCLIKLSILAFYLSFATHRKFRITVYISIAVVLIVSILSIFILAFQCPKNPSYALSPAILSDRGAGHCFDLKIIFYWQAGWNIASDLIILVLPMPLLFPLRMRTIKRISLIAVFSVGFLVPIASGVRLWGLYLWATSASRGKYYGGYIIFWSQVEINTAIICASAPSFQPLFKRAFGELPLFQRSRDAYYYYGGGRNAAAGSPVAEMIGTIRRDSTSILESPERTYCPPKIQLEDDFQTKVVIVKHSAEEEEIRKRVRAFSSQSSLYSQPTSPSSTYSTLKPPTHPNNMLTSGWV